MKKNRSTALFFLAALILAGCVTAKPEPKQEVPFIEERIKEAIRKKEDLNQKLVHTGVTLMCSAISENRLDLVELLVANGADVNKGGHNNFTPLHFAVRSHRNGKYPVDPKAVEYLLAQGADPMAQNADQAIPLHLAAEEPGNPEVLRMLIDAGSPVDAPRTYNVTPLMYAARGGAVDNIDFLLEQGADLYAVSSFGTTPLMFATTYGLERDAAAHLIQRGADPMVKDKKGRTAFLYTVTAAEKEKDESTEDFENRMTAVLDLLLDHGADIDEVDAEGNSSLILAVEKDLPGVTEFLLRNGADAALKNELGQTALFLAASRPDNLDTLENLLEAGADVNGRTAAGETPIMQAVQSGSYKNYRYLLHRGADAHLKTESGYTTLMCAVAEGRSSDIIRHLLLSGLDPRDTEDKGRNTLIEAIRAPELPKGSGDDTSEDEEKRKEFEAKTYTIVNMLLDYGVDVNHRDSDGRTALMYAAENGLVTPGELLWQNGADIALQDNTGKTAADLARNTGTGTPGYFLKVDYMTNALFIAAGQNNRIVLEALLDHGLSVDSRDRSGTPLLMAVDDMPLIRELVKRGADVSSPDSRGTTPLILAAKYNDFGLVDYYLDHGADVNSVSTIHETALTWAIIHQNEEAFTKLLTRGAWLTLPEPCPAHPLMRLFELVVEDYIRVHVKEEGRRYSISYSGSDKPKDIILTFFDSIENNVTKENIPVPPSYDATALLLDSSNPLAQMAESLSKNRRDMARRWGYSGPDATAYQSSPLYKQTDDTYRFFEDTALLHRGGSDTEMSFVRFISPADRLITEPGSWPAGTTMESFWYTTLGDFETVFSQPLTLEIYVGGSSTVTVENFRFNEEWIKENRNFLELLFAKYMRLLVNTHSGS